MKKPRRAAGRRARKAADPAERERRSSPLAAILGAVFTIVVELAKLVREMLVIPAQLWLAIAEAVGAVVLGAWRLVWPLLAAAGRLLAAAERRAQRRLTPKWAVIVVAAAALVALAASQWVDYRSVSVGNEAYTGGVENVAPAPAVDVERAGDAHGWVMIPLALAGLALVGLAIGGRRRAGLGLALVGVAAVAVSLLIDMPKGLDEGRAAVAYEGAQARLLEGFWIQVFAGAALVGAGLLLVAYARPQRADAPAERRRSRARFAELVRRRRRFGSPATGSSA
jgi:hypothetical protein